MARNKRIDFLASLLKGYHTVLDVGSDHGYVLEEAFKRGYIQKGIASDVREMPLERSMKTLRNYPVRGILSDGFLAIDETFDAAVVAGMGAYLIAELMEHAPLHNAVYILQANDKHEHLRKRLNELGFEIKDEYIVHDKFFYIIMIVKRGNQHLTKEDLYLGPYLKHKVEVIPYYERKLKLLKDIMHKSNDDREDDLKEEIGYLELCLSKKGSKE